MSNTRGRWATSALIATIGLLPVAVSRAEDGVADSTGRALFMQKGCIGCHGPEARGGFGPALASTPLQFEEVLHQLRHPRMRMPTFPEAMVSNMEARAIYDYVQSLDAVASSPITERAPEGTGSTTGRATSTVTKRPPKKSARKSPSEADDTATDSTVSAAARETRPSFVRGPWMHDGGGMKCRHW